MDKMKSMRGERDAEMDKHAAAVKTLYAVLTPEQKKVFDTQPMRGGHERGHGRGHGGMHGDSGAQGGHGGHMAPPAAKSLRSGLLPPETKTPREGRFLWALGFHYAVGSRFCIAGDATRRSVH